MGRRSRSPGNAYPAHASCPQVAFTTDPRKSRSSPYCTGAGWHHLCLPLCMLQLPPTSFRLLHCGLFSLPRRMHWCWAGARKLLCICCATALADVAKALACPVFHVNADDAEAVVRWVHWFWFAAFSAAHTVCSSCLLKHNLSGLARLLRPRRFLVPH